MFCVYVMLTLFLKDSKEGTFFLSIKGYIVINLFRKAKKNSKMTTKDIKKKSKGKRNSNKTKLFLNTSYTQTITESKGDVRSLPHFSVFFDDGKDYFQINLRWEPQTFVQDELTLMYIEEWMWDKSPYLADAHLNMVLSAIQRLKKKGKWAFKWYKTKVWRGNDLSSKKKNTNVWWDTKQDTWEAVMNWVWEQATKNRTEWDKINEIEVKSKWWVISRLWGIIATIL